MIDFFKNKIVHLWYSLQNFNLLKLSQIRKIHYLRTKINKKNIELTNYQQINPHCHKYKSN